MAFVVTDNCIQCKYTDCVDVCPVDCFHEGPNFLVIDPEECIDCALCISECPVKAIKSEVDLEPAEKFFANLNEELSLTWPVISKKKPALDCAPDFKDKTNKIIYLKKG